MGGGRVPNRATLEEGRGLLKCAEHRRGRRLVRPPTLHGHARDAVVATKSDMVVIHSLLDRKSGMAMEAGEEPPAGQRVEPRVGIATPNVNPSPHHSVVVPLDRGAMRGILG